MKSRSLWPGLLGVFALILWGDAAPGAEPPCPTSCASARDQLKMIEKAIRRLESIRSANLEFIQELDSESSSQHLKASSNVRIAEARLRSAVASKVKLTRFKSSAECKRCKEGS